MVWCNLVHFFSKLTFFFLQMLATLNGMKIVLTRKWQPEEGEQH